MIARMLRDAHPGDILSIGIVNPYPQEFVDLSRNRKPENFLPHRNPLTYFERAYLLRKYLSHISCDFSNFCANDVVITPYFIPTAYPFEQTMNYLAYARPLVEYISDKDDCELGKKAELNAIGIDVIFVSAIHDGDGEYFSADKIRNLIMQEAPVEDYFDPFIFRLMDKHSLFDTMRSRISSRSQVSRTISCIPA
jgi:hypothetical protein